MKIGDLPSPAAVVDLDILEQNARAMIDRCRRLGVRLRPHVKTHKCLEAARIQLGPFPPAVTVSTLAEARHFAAGGFDDITYAVPIAESRIPEALDIAADLGHFNLLLDHDDTRERIEIVARSRAMTVGVFLKIDCGYHRAGVDPAAPASVELARRVVDSPHLDFRGILTHGGHGYHCHDVGEIRIVARQERDRTRDFAVRLREAGIPCEVVSIGSTPTLSVADDLAGITEVRPGNYLFFDSFQAAIGSCTLDDVAFTVVGTVIGCHPDRDAVILDVGGTALSHDPGPRHVDPDCGFGRVRTLDGEELGAGLRIGSLSQEHAVVPTAGPVPSLRIGSRVRVVPNHACMAAALFEEFHVARGDTVVEIWSPVKGW